MKAIHIRDVPEDTLSRLKSLAHSHHRSLQGELHAILEQAARLLPPAQESTRLKLATVHVGGESSWRREDVYGTNGR
jgi:plasmid stability protein